MPIRWKEALYEAWIGLRAFLITILFVGGVQVLISLILWPVLFRTQPLGFSMALSLVGFGSWILALLVSMGDRRRRRLAMSMPQETPGPVADRSLMEHVQEQVQRSGCGFVMLAASIIPLAIAFALRLQADLRAGLSLTDIFPPMP
jgi:hypothetical protein